MALVKFYTIKEAAELLSLDELSVRRMIDCGALEAKDFSPSGKRHKWRISETAILTYEPPCSTPSKHKHIQTQKKAH